ncbi:MAG TPA: twin-arginine translocation signal domain-containing protein [Candidatus Hydrogenedentes bacterium]|nr:twin-arginine translocation signal domain-containing protein [Candidatus Hydrogenedentota bacterium]
MMFSRRDFIKTAGIGVAVPGAVLGASDGPSLPELRPNTPSPKQREQMNALFAESFAGKHTVPHASRKGYRRNNILFITSDQHHYMAMGYNDPAVKTPNLDRLAARGVIFDRAYTVNPTCTPTRASLITGKYPSQHGAWALGTALAESEPCIGNDFARAGYRTALIGKAHFQPLQGAMEHPSLEAYPVLQDLDFWRHFNGPFYGFEHVELARNHVDEAHVGQHYALWMEEKGGRDCWRDWFSKPTGTQSRQYGVWNIPEEYHYNTWITERTNALMEQYVREERPFFLWASYFARIRPTCCPNLGRPCMPRRTSFFPGFRRTKWMTCRFTTNSPGCRVRDRNTTNDTRSTAAADATGFTRTGAMTRTWRGTSPTTTAW